MFTINQISEAHSKVKSGTDFPQYIQDLIKLGVRQYTTYVSNGHTEYEGNNNYRIQSDARYAALPVARKNNKAQFEHHLQLHQQGQSDYPAFCRQAAETGVEKWVTDLSEMTCTYFDREGNKILEEKIPSL